MTGFINTLLDLSLKGSLVIGIILVLRLALKKAPKIFSYSLWAIAFVSLILPFSIKSPLAFTNFLPKDLVIKNEVETRDNFIKVQEPQGENNFIAKTSDRKENFQSISPSENARALGNSSTNSKNLAKEEIYFYIWLSGVSILVITSALSTFKLKKKLKYSKQVDDNVYENDRVPTAFVFGLIKPKIYLPRGLSPEEEKYIKKHEQVHIERLDHLWKFLAFVITIVHFFNPLVWLAYYLMGLDMELSCDEKVIKDLGHGIKKDYSQSLLAFSTGRKILTASPLAFGENNTKTRIKNILAYKKPKKIVLAICFILIALVAVGCLTDKNEKESLPSDENKTTSEEVKVENKTAADYAQAYIDEQINNFSGVQIYASQVDEFKKLADFKNISGKDFQVYLLKYSLQFAKDQDLKNYDGFIGTADSDNWLRDVNDNNYMVFQVSDSGLTYIDTVFQGEFNPDLSEGQRKNALREILERKNIIPRETYASDHYVGSYLDFVGRAGKVLLSQGDQDGLWLVERWIDENGNIYYADNKSLAGDEEWRRDPEKVALDFINSMTTVKLSSDKIQVEKLENLDDFYKLPESIYHGYIEEIKTDQEDMSDLIHVTLVEWLTQDDEERAKALGLDINEDMPSGFYVNKTQILETFFLDEDTKYYIGDYITSSQADPFVSKKVFIDYVKANKDVLFEIYSIGGKTIKIQEAYLP